MASSEKTGSRPRCPAPSTNQIIYLSIQTSSSLSTQINSTPGFVNEELQLNQFVVDTRREVGCSYNSCNSMESRSESYLAGVLQQRQSGHPGSTSGEPIKLNPPSAAMSTAFAKTFPKARLSQFNTFSVIVRVQDDTHRKAEHDKPMLGFTFSSWQICRIQTIFRT